VGVSTIHDGWGGSTWASAPVCTRAWDFAALLSVKSREVIWQQFGRMIESGTGVAVGGSVGVGVAVGSRSPARTLMKG
jgi:hypothetical protein